MKPRISITRLMAVALVLTAAVTVPQYVHAQCVTPPSGMVAWWPLDETAGPTANDIAGVINNAGTWMNNPTPATGKVSGGLTFNGTNSVDVPDSPELNFGTGDFSIDLWIRTVDSLAVTTILNKRSGTVSNPTGYAIYLCDGYLGSQIGDGVWYNNWVSTGYVADGKWHHIAVTVDRDNASGWLHYVDGKAVATPGDPTPVGSLDNTAPLVIAKNLITPSHRFAETLDEVELFKRVLDSSEIRAIWAADSLGKCKDSCHATGDADNNGIGLTTGDMIYLAAFINDCGPVPIPLYSCDLNGDGIVDLADLQLYQDYFVYGIGVFAPYGGYPVLCPCDPVAAPTQDTVTIFGLEHTSAGMACLETVGDTLKVTRLGSSGKDGVGVDFKNQYTSWSCSIGALTGSTGAGASLQIATYAIVDGVANQQIGTIRETIVGTDETKLSVDYESETYTVVVCNNSEVVLYMTGVEADNLSNGPNLLWPQERWCPWPFCSKIQREQNRWFKPHRRCPGWKGSDDLPPGFSSVIELDSTSESAVLNWAALGIHDLSFTRIEIIPDDLADNIARFSFAVATIHGIDSVCITSESASLYCCPEVGMGNVDGSSDGYVTMGDLTVMIDYLFISLTPLECPEAGNVDLSTDGLVTMGDLTVMIDNLFITLAPLQPCPSKSLSIPATLLQPCE